MNEDCARVSDSMRNSCFANLLLNDVYITFLHGRVLVPPQNTKRKKRSAAKIKTENLIKRVTRCHCEGN